MYIFVCTLTLYLNIVYPLWLYSSMWLCENLHFPWLKIVSICIVKVIAFILSSSNNLKILKHVKLRIVINICKNCFIWKSINNLCDIWLGSSCRYYFSDIVPVHERIFAAKQYFISV